MVLGDEMLTPDSSRFWPAQGYEPGHSQPSFDKQFARDWLTAHPGNDWTLPEEIVEKLLTNIFRAMKCLQEPNYSKRLLSHTAETNIQAEPFYTGFCLLFIMLQHSAFPEKFSYLRMFNFLIAISLLSQNMPEAFSLKVKLHP